MNQNKKIDKSTKIIFTIFKDNDIEKIGSDVLNILSEISSISLKFKQFLSTKRIDKEIKKDILSNVLSGILNESQLSLVYCMLDSVDFNYIESINKKYQKLMDDSLGLVKVTAFTANSMSDMDLSKLSLNIKSKINMDVSIENIEDKKILGGIKLKVGNTLIDGSLSTKLEKLKQSMINK